MSGGCIEANLARKGTPEVLIVWSGRGFSGKTTLVSEIALLARSRGLVVDVADLSFEGQRQSLSCSNVEALLNGIAHSEADLVVVDTPVFDLRAYPHLRGAFTNLMEAGAWGVQIIDDIDLFNSGSAWFMERNALLFGFSPNPDRQLAVLSGRGISWPLEEVAQIGQLEEFKQFDLIGAMPDRTPVRRWKLFRRATRDVSDDQTTNSLILDRMGFQHRA